MTDFESLINTAISESSDQSSHTELDINTFHPSQLSMCRRQMLLSKLGIEQHSTKTLGIFKIGTIVHKWLENNLPNYTDLTVETEKPVSYTIDTGERIDKNINIVGTCDLWIPNFQLVVDYKTQTGWHFFDPYEDNLYNQKKSHLTQLSIYMLGLKAAKGKLVYIDKGKFEARQYPNENDDFIAVQENLVNKASNRAIDVMNELEQNYPKNNSEIPFDKCDCWQCDSENTEDNEFSHL